jgi:DNA-binding NtrC family response regulator
MTTIRPPENNPSYPSESEHQKMVSMDPMSISLEVSSSIRILVVDDDRALREGLSSMLQVDGYSVTVTGRGDEAVEMLRRSRFDIVLVDLHMTPVSGMDVLSAAIAASKQTIVIVITGNPSLTSSVEALRAGAWDYLPKPFSATHLQILIGRASHMVLVSRETRNLREQLAEKNGNSDKMTLLGASPSFRKAVELARRVAGTDASVMISGESGTGKEVIAQFIHKHSPRASRPLVTVNCAALPDNLLESELFGHVRGAFTGADRNKPGLLETANGGTFFLDEVTEMSLPLQAKLLRVLQDGVVRRVGSEQERDAVVNVRFISATNREPHEAVRSGLLREDLFYRLRVVPIKLPPLRERLSDIAQLANHFLELYWERHRGSRARAPRLSDACIDFLRARSWRGNVRELQNVIEHVAVIADSDRAIEPEDIPAYDDGGHVAGEAAVPIAIMSEPYHLAKDQLVTNFEREYLTRLVLRAGGNMSKAARLASIDRTTLYRLMEKYGLRRDEFSGAAE